MLTTLAGSYPFTGHSPEQAIARAIEAQIKAGIDLVVDGQVRANMVDEYAAHFPGLAASPPRVVGRVLPPREPIRVVDFRIAQEIAGDRPLKIAVTGPITLARALALTPDAPYRSNGDPRLLDGLTAALLEEVRALLAAGAATVQLDEPALACGRGLAEAKPRLRRLFAEVPRPVLHVCGDSRAAFRELMNCGASILHVEGTNKARWPPIDAAGLRAAGVTLCLGCVRSDRNVIETPEQVRALVEPAVARFGAENLWLSADCGFRQLSSGVARAKTRRIVEAARTVDWDQREN